MLLLSTDHRIHLCQKQMRCYQAILMASSESKHGFFMAACQRRDRRSILRERRWRDARAQKLPRELIKWPTLRPRIRSRYGLAIILADPGPPIHSEFGRVPKFQAGSESLQSCEEGQQDPPEPVIQKNRSLRN